ncbi:hypothetical protein [Thalassotalea agarivorans]|uniref:Uncharacterized protein n=1 Tax=Thalassotalea agarivorans TaxID=349064 RepID=A0A1I0DWB0_THASX|nr:hypothetical protein [Thalassotalea agarivorans]SET36518.1 hypothetical protein SAMN05660429_01614 [Thalassotalea agarivorans]
MLKHRYGLMQNSINVKIFTSFCLLFCSVASFFGVANTQLELQLPASDRGYVLPVPQNTIYKADKLSLKHLGKKIEADVQVLMLYPLSKQSTKQAIRLLYIKPLPRLSNNTLVTLVTSQNGKESIIALGANKKGALLIYPSFDWLRQAILLHPPGVDVNAQWYIQPQIRYARFIADKPLMLKHKYPPEKAAQWLYDRPQSFFQLYLFTQDNQWLEQGFSEANFYASKVDDKGRFVLKTKPDVKYANSKGMVTAYMLSGDALYLDVVKRLYNLTKTWDEVYTLGRGFWTERHQAAALNSALSLWEVYLKADTHKRVQEIITATESMTFNPPNDWPFKSCPLHTVKSHEGKGDNTPVCSPWMMALLGDAIWRYQLLLQDNAHQQLLVAFATFVAKSGTYPGAKRHAHITMIPKYFVSFGPRQFEEDNMWTDPQHTCDVAGLVAKGYYMLALQGKKNEAIAQAFGKLTQYCANTANKLKRKHAKNKVWRVRPPRKFGWMYSTTSDLPWIAKRYLDVTDIAE